MPSVRRMRDGEILEVTVDPRRVDALRRAAGEPVRPPEPRVRARAAGVPDGA